jgi:hypothetical protein
MLNFMTLYWLKAEKKNTMELEKPIATLGVKFPAFLSVLTSMF